MDKAERGGRDEEHSGPPSGGTAARISQQGSVPLLSQVERKHIAKRAEELEQCASNESNQDIDVLAVSVVRDVRTLLQALAAMEKERDVWKHQANPIGPWAGHHWVERFLIEYEQEKAPVGDCRSILDRIVSAKVAACEAERDAAAKEALTERVSLRAEVVLLRTVAEAAIEARPYVSAWQNLDTALEDYAAWHRTQWDR